VDKANKLSYESDMATTREETDVPEGEALTKLMQHTNKPRSRLWLPRAESWDRVDPAEGSVEGT
jgi:hypothetical protein